MEHCFQKEQRSAPEQPHSLRYFPAVWTQIKSDITGKPIIVPASDTATTLGAALLAGVGVGFYKDYEEAVSLTVKETRRHEPNPKNKAVYDKTFETYIELYKSLAHIMTAK